MTRASTGIIFCQTRVSVGYLRICIDVYVWLCECEWWDSNGSFDFRRAYVWSCELHIRCDHVCACEVQGVCPSMRIWWSCNACNSWRGHIWFFLIWEHEEGYCVLWVAPRLVWIYRDVQVQNTMCQCHE